MKRLVMAAVFGLGFSSATLAGTVVLVDHVPGGATSAVVIAVCKAALINRQWTVTAAGPDSIDAELNHSQIEAKIRILFKDWRVLYEGSAVRTFRTGQQQQTLKRNGDVPDRWIDYLRRDISTALATIPETPR